MKIEETLNEGLKRKYDIVLSAKLITQRVDDSLKGYSKKVNIPGFRPGKVPFSFLKKKYGEAVRGEEIEKLFNETLQKIVQDYKVRPIGEPDISDLSGHEEKDGDVSFSFNMELYPEMELVNVEELEFDRPMVEVSDEDIVDVLENIRTNSKGTEALNEPRKSQNGDTLKINFVGSINGEEFEGGKGDNYSLELGSGSFIPGFEEQLIDKDIGETIDVVVTFPENYGAKELAGKEAVFKTEILEVLATVTKELDDEAAKKFGFDSLDALKNMVKEQRKVEFDRASRAIVKQKILDKLDEAHNLELPQNIVENEFSSIWKQFEETRKNKPEEIDEEDKNKSDDELKENYRNIAARRVKLALILSELGNKNSIEVSEQEIDNAIRAEAYRYQGSEQKVIDFYKNNPKAKENIRMPLFEDKVIDLIIEKAKINEYNVSKDELENLTK